MTIPADPALGRIGNYRLKALLGRGGMGEVFLAWDERLERRVALKRVLPDPPPDKRARARFRREARAVARLSHPSIVQVFDLLETDDGDVLVMEYVEGMSLAKLIASGRLDLATTLRLAAEIAEGLDEAHGKGLVHRDLKSENVLVTASGHASAGHASAGHASAGHASAGHASAGHAKILDFGVARLLWNEGLSGHSLAAAITASGALVGTVHAMSPEQASGRPVDHRSDLFAFGALLYEMLAARQAFRGSNVLDTLRRVISREPTPLAELRDDLPPELVELVEALLAKEPAARPQNARVVAGVLERLRGSSTDAPSPPREPAAIVSPSDAAGTTVLSTTEIAALPTGEWPALTPQPPLPEGEGEPDSPGLQRLPFPSGRGVGTAALLTLAVLAYAAGWWTRSRPEDSPTALPTAAASSIAVLHFQNLNRDGDLDWMRQGIAESLTTDLAQSPEIDVLSGGRLYKILKDLGALDAPADFELIREVAAQGGVGTVLRGNFTRVGKQLSINVSLETARGEILKSVQVRDHQDRFFLLVDELGAAVRGHFDVAVPTPSPRSIAMVTTDSVEAWRYYIEGISLFRASKLEEAELLLDRAVEVDPDFALAFAELGQLRRNLGKTAEAATRRAAMLADRLPRHRRYNVEGSYYSSRWSTYRQAIEVYRQGLELDPQKSGLRKNLGLLHASLEQYEEAIEMLGPLTRKGSVFVYSTFNVAFSHAALDRHASGERLLAELVRRQEGGWLPQIYLGWFAMYRGDLAAAAGALDKAQGLRPGDVWVHYSHWRLAVLREDWPRAEAEATAMASKTDAYSRWLGAVSLARNRLYQGRSEEALGHLDDAAGAFPSPNPSNALARCFKAQLLLARGLSEQALTEGRRAREEGKGYWPELQGIYFAALAEEALGRRQAADALAAILEARFGAFPNRVEERQILHLEGRRALLRGDPVSAVLALRRAQDLLPLRGVEIHDYVLPDHLPVWTALGEAELRGGNPRAAREWLGRAVRSGTEHIEFPVAWISSFSLLGRAHRQLAEEDEARRHFDRFLSFWRKADFARSQVEEAQRP